MTLQDTRFNQFLLLISSRGEWEMVKLFWLSLNLNRLTKYDKRTHSSCLLVIHHSAHCSWFMWGAFCLLAFSDCLLPASLLTVGALSSLKETSAIFSRTEQEEPQIISTNSIPLCDSVASDQTIVFSGTFRMRSEGNNHSADANIELNVSLRWHKPINAWCLYLSTDFKRI